MAVLLQKNFPYFHRSSFMFIKWAKMMAMHVFYALLTHQNMQVQLFFKLSHDLYNQFDSKYLIPKVDQFLGKI